MTENAPVIARNDRVQRQCKKMWKKMILKLVKEIRKLKQVTAKTKRTLI